ncbi:discoidin domain-containing protein [Jiangella muralis]|uniref:discoidin domain-containing protein n=1 Tax=Jiangella muralis TaxID=702383 RepID=UPI00069F8249|nr:discoidin domain-containing protein [Jiangella muralis]
MAVCGSCGNRVSELALECARCRAPIGATPEPETAAAALPPPPPRAVVTPVAVALAPPPAPPAPTPPPPPPAREREAVSRTVLIIAAAAALIVVAMITVALIAQDPSGDDDAGGEAAAAGEVAATAEVEVPGTAPDGVDSTGATVGYSAAQLVDGDPSTAWRVEGDAEGDEIVLTLPDARTITAVGIVNGYAKVDEESGDRRYGQNRRVLAATWVFDDGTEATFELEETVEPQVFTLDAPVETTTVRIRLDEVSGPGGRDFTAISELSLTGR